MANQERKNRRRKAKAKKKAERGKVTVKQEKAEDDGSEEANLDHDNDDGECLVSFAVFLFWTLWMQMSFRHHTVRS